MGTVIGWSHFELYAIGCELMLENSKSRDDGL